MVTTVGGLVGSFVPALPGAVIIWGGALLHGALTGFDPLGLYAQITLAALTGLSAGGQLAISELQDGTHIFCQVPPKGREADGVGGGAVTPRVDIGDGLGDPGRALQYRFRQAGR